MVVWFAQRRSRHRNTGQVSVTKEAGMHYYRSSEGPRFVYGGGARWIDGHWEAYSVEQSVHPDTGQCRLMYWHR